MDLNYLYKLASLLDSQGKYVESDVVYDSMIRLAKGGKKYYGNQKTRPKPDFRPMPGARPNPNSPGLVPVQSTPPVAPQAAAPQVSANPAATASRLSPKSMIRLFASQNADMRAIVTYLNKVGYPIEEFAEAYDDAYGKGKFQYDLDKFKAGEKSGPNIRMPKVTPKLDYMSQETMEALIKKAKGNFKTLEKFLANNGDLKRQFVNTFNQQYGPGAYEGKVAGTSTAGTWDAGTERAQTKPSGNPGRGGTNPNTGAGAANNAGARPGTGGSASAGGASPNAAGGAANNAGARPGTGGSAAGGASPKPGGPSGYAGPKPKFDPIPENFNPIKAGANAAKYRLLILQNPGLRPEIAARLEMLVSKGYLDPKTGNWTRNFNDLQMSQLERFYRNLNRAQDVASDAASAGSKAGQAGAAGFSASNFAKILNTTKAGQSLVKALYGAQRIFTSVVSKIPPPIFKVLSKVKFVFILLNFARFVQALLNGTLEYKQTIEFIAACASISPQVLAALGSIPIVGPGLVIAVGAVNLGAADVVEFFANPEAGLNYMGFQITGPSMRRKTDEIDFRTVDISKLDPSVQNALNESIPLIQSGKKIAEILQDPGMVQRHPWLSKRDDIRFTQFSGTLGAGGFYKQYKQKRTQSEESTNYLPGAQPPKRGTDQGNAIYNNREQNQTQQPKQVIRNYNDLLYKAYVDVAKTTNVTLENMVNMKNQIIDKINALAPSYPNINSQQSIAMLENRIRKYSAQAKPA